MDIQSSPLLPATVGADLRLRIGTGLLWALALTVLLAAGLRHGIMRPPGIAAFSICSHFEGPPERPHALSRLASLPLHTRVYCAHEYTEANLRFALAVEPDNQALLARTRRVARQRAAGEPTVPSALADELATNPFLRVREPEVIRAAQAHAGRPLNTPVEVFAALRAWKNDF